MARRSINLHDKIREVLQHTSPMLPEAHLPIRHFERSVNLGFALLDYIDAHIDPQAVYPAPYNRHLAHLRRLVLGEMIQAFERFLKELAAVCADHLAPYTHDDRFDEFAPKRTEQIAAFVTSGSIGRALCESDTWLNNKTINDRFRSLLKTPFGADWEYLFPGPGQGTLPQQQRAATLAILWQIRHNLSHNVGVMTHSDAMKLRMLVGGPVPSDCRLAPTMEDLRYVDRFLSETATDVNQRVGNRLAVLLEIFHRADPTLFDAQARANEVSQQFAFAVTINGHIGVL
jgi:hypothetical protein